MKTSLLSVARQVQTSAQNAGLLQVSSVSISTKNSYSSLVDMVQNFREKYLPDTVNPKDRMRDNKWAKMFCVEGNISAGKGAFTQEFAEKLELRYFPIADSNYDIHRSLYYGMAPEYAEWNLSPDSAIQRARAVDLNHFLTEPTDAAHTGRLQTLMVKQRNWQWCDALAHLLKTGQGIAMNRHFYSDPVFAEAQKRMGWINKSVMDYYERLFQRGDTYLLPPQVVIYLDVSAEECYERIQAGDNEAEKQLPLDYLKRIEEVYKTVYIPKARDDGVNVIEIDWSNPLAVDEVIDDLDGSGPSLQAGYSKWDCYYKELILIRKRCEDVNYRFNRLTIYHPNEELWTPTWVEDVYECEKEHAPWRYKKGFNAALGDKMIWLKG